MKLIDLFNALDRYTGYIQEGLFVQRSKDKKVVSSCAGLAKGRLINFLFENDICNSGVDTLNDLRKISVDGKITNRGSGPSCTIEMLNVLLRNKMQDEYAYVMRLVDYSVAANIYLKAGDGHLLKKRQKDNNLQYWEGNLEEVCEYVKVHYHEQFIEELKALHKYIYDKFKEELKRYLKQDAGKIKDAAMLITWFVAASLCELTFNDNSKIGEFTRNDIEEKKKILKSVIKDFLIFNEKKSTEEVLAQIYYDTYGVLSDVKDKNNTRRVSERLYSKFEEAFQFPHVTSTDGKKWDFDGLVGRKNAVWAPNGYGKTTFLKSLLFSAICNYKNNSDFDNSFYYRARKFHNIGKNYFAIFIEANYFSFVISTEGIEWIYEISQKQMGFERNLLPKEDFFDLIKKKNSEGKLIVLVDGYDELDDTLRDIFFDRINELLEMKSYGENAIMLVSSRSYFETVNFNGYDFWTIDSLSFRDNSEFVRNFIKAYTRGENDVTSEQLYNLISNNHFLSEAINTPEILLDVICGGIQYLKTNERYDIHDIVEETIEDLIQRIDPLHPKTVTEYGRIDDIKKVYSLFAINVLTSRNGVKEGNFSAMLRDIIEQLCEEENESKYKHRKIRKMLDLEDDEIVRLFFTKMSILKSDGKYVRFLSENFSKHLAARRIIDELGAEGSFENSWFTLVQMRELKYEVFTMICTLAYYVENTTLQDIIIPKVECIFFKLLNCAKEKCIEKIEIEKLQLMIIDILQKKYGDNIMYNSRNIISKVILDNIETIRRILSEDTKNDINDRNICLAILEKAV